MLNIGWRVISFKSVIINLNLCLFVSKSFESLTSARELMFSQPLRTLDIYLATFSSNNRLLEYLYNSTSSRTNEHYSQVYHWWYYKTLVYSLMFSRLGYVSLSSLVYYYVLWRCFQRFTILQLDLFSKLQEPVLSPQFSKAFSGDLTTAEDNHKISSQSWASQS